MSAAEEAYRAAEALIAEAKADGRARLGFEAERFRTLNRIPPRIGDLQALASLDFDRTAVSDLTPLSGLSGLRTLWLNRTAVSDLAPLSGLVELTWLWLNETAVSDLAPLAGLNGLTDLRLTGTAVSDLAPLSGLSGLEELWLNETDVNDLRPLSGLHGLRELLLDDTPVIDLRPLRGLEKLADEPESFGLSFKRCGAAKVDARIAEISRIGDDRERARALFDHLRTWEPPPAGRLPDA